MPHPTPAPPRRGTFLRAPRDVVVVVIVVVVVVVVDVVGGSGGGGESEKTTGKRGTFCLLNASRLKHGGHAGRRAQRASG